MTISYCPYTNTSPPACIKILEFCREVEKLEVRKVARDCEASSYYPVDAPYIGLVNELGRAAETLYKLAEQIEKLCK